MRRGIGTIELMMVLVLMSIAAAMVIPSFNSTADSRVDAAIRLLRSDIEYAQIHSIANPNDPLAVVLAEDGTGYWVSNSNDPDVPIMHQSSGEPYAVVFGEGRASMSTGVQAQVEQLDTGMLQFDALGGLVDPTTDPIYRFSCDEAEISMSVRAGTGFTRIHH